MRCGKLYSRAEKGPKNPELRTAKINQWDGELRLVATFEHMGVGAGQVRVPFSWGETIDVTHVGDSWRLC